MTMRITLLILVLSGELKGKERNFRFESGAPKHMLQQFAFSAAIVNCYGPIKSWTPNKLKSWLTASAIAQAALETVSEIVREVSKCLARIDEIVKEHVSQTCESTPAPNGRVDACKKIIVSLEQAVKTARETPCRRLDESFEHNTERLLDTCVIILEESQEIELRTNVRKLRSETENRRRIRAHSGSESISRWTRTENGRNFFISARASFSMNSWDRGAHFGF